MHAVQTFMHKPAGDDDGDGAELKRLRRENERLLEANEALLRRERARALEDARLHAELARARAALPSGAVPSLSLSDDELMAVFVPTHHQSRLSLAMPVLNDDELDVPSASRSPFSSATPSPYAAPPPYAASSSSSSSLPPYSSSSSSSSSSLLSPYSSSSSFVSSPASFQLAPEPDDASPRRPRRRSRAILEFEARVERARAIWPRVDVRASWPRRAGVPRVAWHFIVRDGVLVSLPDGTVYAEPQAAFEAVVRASSAPEAHVTALLVKAAGECARDALLENGHRELAPTAREPRTRVRARRQRSRRSMVYAAAARVLRDGIEPLVQELLLLARERTNRLLLTERLVECEQRMRALDCNPTVVAARAMLDAELLGDGEHN